MAELKTKKTNASVSAFINSVKDEKRKADAKKLVKIFESATKAKPKMWGTSIIGFGTYHYKSSKSTQEGDWFLAGFSPRKQAMSIYIMSGFKGVEKILKDLGPHKRSSGCCLYIKDLDDIHIPILKKLIKTSVFEMKEKKGMC